MDLTGLNLLSLWPLSLRSLALTPIQRPEMYIIGAQPLCSQLSGLSQVNSADVCLPHRAARSFNQFLFCTVTEERVKTKEKLSPQDLLKCRTINVLICANLSCAAVRPAGSEEAVPAVPGPHDVHWRRSKDRNQGVPVPVQAEEVELQHCGQLICVWTGHADR